MIYEVSQSAATLGPKSRPTQTRVIRLITVFNIVLLSSLATASANDCGYFAASQRPVAFCQIPIVLHPTGVACFARRGTLESTAPAHETNSGAFPSVLRYRDWYNFDCTGRTSAVLISLNGGTVTLQVERTGTSITGPIERLSAGDQTYLRAFVTAQNAAVTFGKSPYKADQAKSKRMRQLFSVEGIHPNLAAGLIHSATSIGGLDFSEIPGRSINIRGVTYEVASAPIAADGSGISEIEIRDGAGRRHVVTRVDFAPDESAEVTLYSSYWHPPAYRFVSNAVSSRTVRPSHGPFIEPLAPELRWKYKLVYDKNNSVWTDLASAKALQLMAQAEGDWHTSQVLALVNAGDYYESRADYGKAVHQYTAAISQMPNGLSENAPTFLRRACALLELGNTGPAIEDLTEAITLGREQPEVTSAPISSSKRPPWVCAALELRARAYSILAGDALSPENPDPDGAAKLYTAAVADANSVRDTSFTETLALSAPRVLEALRRAKIREEILRSQRLQALQISDAPTKLSDLQTEIGTDAAIDYMMHANELCNVVNPWMTKADSTLATFIRSTNPGDRKSDNAIEAFARDPANERKEWELVPVVTWEKVDTEVDRTEATQQRFDVVCDAFKSSMEKLRESIAPDVMTPAIEAGTVVTSYGKAASGFLPASQIAPFFQRLAARAGYLKKIDSDIHAKKKGLSDRLSDIEKSYVRYLVAKKEFAKAIDQAAKATSQPPPNDN